MLTIIIAVVCGIAGWAAGVYLLDSVWWGAALFPVGFLLPSILINLRIKKKMEKVFGGVQSMIAKEQDTLRRKINMMQAKGVGTTKGMQKQLERQQAGSIRNALKELDQLQPLYKWNFLAERQTNTLRGQLFFQIGEFEEADKALRKSLAMDAFTVAIKIVRAYKNGDMAAAEKMFKRGVKRFKGDKGTLLYALYSWILVKEGKIDEAVVLLNKGKEDTEDNFLKQNWEHLANGRVRHFSNAGLGDQWYALQLETPKPVKVRQRASGRMHR